MHFALSQHGWAQITMLRAGGGVFRTPIAVSAAVCRLTLERRFLRGGASFLSASRR